MEFKEILEIYEDNMRHVERMLNPDCLSFFKKSEEYWKGYRKACHDWFQKMKIYSNFKPQVRKATSEEKQIYKYRWEETNTEQEPDLILEYRGECAPIYTDDYGQQEIMIYNGECCSGGPYNPGAYYDFCDFIDFIKDNIE